MLVYLMLCIGNIAAEVVLLYLLYRLEERYLRITGCGVFWLIIGIITGPFLMTAVSIFAFIGLILWCCEKAVPLFRRICGFTLFQIGEPQSFD